MKKLSQAQKMEQRIREIETQPNFGYRSQHSNDEYAQLKRALPYANTYVRQEGQDNPLSNYLEKNT